jgi:serine/threonine protein kinase
MTLRPGSRFGPYEVTAQIGAGDMGAGYQATDTKLKRQVAIRVLPESGAALVMSHSASAKTSTSFARFSPSRCLD